ncbi:MAG TPA: lipopolysaccharide kinase InaA family protein, partial [Phycisphaerae bacterium]|nr:lipopolysaccharide kinase InaA family protein [Phycisphaerae bacterium]
MKTILEIEPAYQAALQAAGLADFDAMMEVRGDAAIGWHNHRETLPLEIDVDGQCRRFFLKRVFKVPPKHAFWPLFRLRRGCSQPSREWHILGELARADIPAMRRVAFGEKRRLGLPIAAFLLVEAVPMQYTLENWLVPGFPRPPDTDQRILDRLVHELGAFVGKLAAAGFVWPDIHAKHIFAAPSARQADGVAWEFYLIDVERMTRRPPTGLPSPLPAEVASRQLGLLRDSVRPMPLDQDDLRRFFAGYLRRSEKKASAGTDGCSAEEALSTGTPPCSADAASCPRLPDDYEHPRHAGFVRVGDIQAEPRMIEVLRRAGLGGFQDIIESGMGKSLHKPGLQSYRDRVRLELADERG